MTEGPSLVDSCNDTPSFLPLLSVDELKVIFSVRIRHSLWLQDWIKHDFEHVFNHVGHQHFHVLVGRSQEGIVVHLDEPDAEVFVEQEVKSEELKAVLTIVDIHLLAHAKEDIDDDVLDSGDEVVVHVEIVLAVVLVKVLLQVVVVERVALFVLRVALAFDLQALVRQVHEVVLVPQVVLSGAGAQVAMLIKIDTVVVRDDRPDANVKLSTVEQKRVLYVLLHHPVLRLRVLVEDELVNVTQISEDFYAATLVKRGRLDQPHVLRAMLERHALLVRATPGDLLVTRHQHIDLVVVADPRDNEGRRRRVKHSV